ncbi:unnamed protein product [Lota lota]
MEAEVGLMNRQIMEVVDHNCNSLTAQVEVKKLQALVRSLEQQNQQLRSRQKCSMSPAAASSKLEYKENDDNNNNTPSGVLAYFHAYFSDKQRGDEEATTVLDDVEMLDLEAMFSKDSDDETWLYVSSRAGVCVDSPPLSPLTWCRQVLDSPRSDEALKTPSLHRQRVSRWRPSPSSPSSPLLSALGASPTLVGKPCSTPLFSRRPASPLASPLFLTPRRSLSPLLKEPLPPAERSPTFLSHLASRGKTPPLTCWNSGLSLESFDDDERDAIAMGYKLHDLTDVQVMARLQEESLRQDYASAAPRRERRRSLSLRTPRPAEEVVDCGLLSPPRLCHSSLPRPHTFSSARDWHRSSGSLYTPPATPPTSPVPTYASGPFFTSPPAWAGPVGPSAAQPQVLRPGSDKLRQSMPNLVRAPSMPSVHTPVSQAAPLSLMRNSLSFDSSAQFHSSTNKLTSRSPVQLQNRVHSVGGFSSSPPTQPPKATAYVSPTIKGSVSVLCCTTPTQPHTPRSSLPRPAASSAPRTRIAQSPRSLLTPPKSMTPLTALRHASWNDGCY